MRDKGDYENGQPEILDSFVGLEPVADLPSCLANESQLGKSRSEMPRSPCREKSCRKPGGTVTSQSEALHFIHPAKSLYIYIYMDFLSRQGASWHLSRKCVRLYHSAYPGQPFSLRVSCVSKIFTPSEHPVILATSYCWRKSAKSYKTDKMGAVRITSLNPKFNGSHF